MEVKRGGNRGPKISLKVKREIRKRALERPRGPRGALALELQDLINRWGEPIPGQDTLEKMISEIRNSDDDLDKPWSAISLSQHQIYPEVLPCVLRIWALSLTKEVKSLDPELEAERIKRRISDPFYSWKVIDPNRREILTTREALWISRLIPVFKNGGINLDCLDNLEEIWATAQVFAINEKLLEEEGEYPSKRENILHYWLNDAELYSISSEGGEPSASDLQTQLTREYTSNRYPEYRKALDERRGQRENKTRRKSRNPGKPKELL